MTLSSKRHLAETLGFSRHLVHRILRQNGLYPYHFQRVQQLLPRDQEPRINFCKGIFIHLFNVFFHNYLLWAEENPRVIRQHAFQYRWTINVWTGIIANRIVNNKFTNYRSLFPPRLTGEVYTNYLEHQLPELLEGIPLCVRQQLILQHDKAPAHFLRQACNFLSAHYRDKWKDQGGPIIWLTRSSDLNVLDYFVWGHIKNLVEQRRNGTETEIREAILADFNTITPEMAYRATCNIIRRAEFSLQERGRHFEQFLY
ncbi:hypothetical protein ACFW04_013597 [Cataglyphis niger]